MSIKNFELWSKKVTDEKLVKELEKMRGNAIAIENAFYKELEFGTGGLRGEIGVGTNCLNIYTIRKVTQGIANYMRDNKMTKAAISCDSRINSDLFAKCVAEVFANCGITCYITKELMPTPFLSYITRKFKCDIGVMITASHNPAKYNGYKVYGGDGCQLTDNAASEMIGYINPIDPFSVATKEFDEYLIGGQIHYVEDSVTDNYLDEVQKQSINNADGLKIVYSPLNGAGYKLVPQMLKRIKAEDITIVKEQGMPDGNFTTCSFPNPEKPEALKLGLELAKKVDADILIATDPDCDRMGIAVRHNDEYRLFSGNEVGVLFADYLLREKKKNGTLAKNPIIVKTIVTSALVEKIAAEYNATVLNVLTGFKYIGDIIGKLEAKNETNRFVLGFEESYGYLAGSYVRDKDAVIASMLIAEIAATYKKQGKTLVDKINEIYAKYGTFEHRLKSYEYAGAQGNAKMKELLKNLRETLPILIGGAEVVKTIDYNAQTEFDLPKANVLSFVMADGSQLIVRPSGTEPLIKLYLTASKTVEENKKVFERINKQLDEMFAN